MKKIYIRCSARNSLATSIIDYLIERLKDSDFQIVIAAEYDDFISLIDEDSDNYDLTIFFWEQFEQSMAIEAGYCLGRSLPFILVGDFKNIPPSMKSIEFYSIHKPANEIENYLVTRIFSTVAIKQSISIGESACRINEKALASGTSHESIERVVESWFSASHFNILKRQEPDAGYDLMVEDKNGQKALVEVKYSKSPSEVSVSTVKQLANHVMFTNSVSGVIISNAPFSESAQHYANSTSAKIILLKYEDLAKLKKFPTDITKFDNNINKLRNLIFNSAKDLKQVVEYIQLKHDEIKMLNSDVISLMQIDKIIRSNAKSLNIDSWNNRYFNSNLSGFEAPDVISKTDKYIQFLIEQGPKKHFKGPDYAIRNLKHLFDIVPEAIIQNLLPSVLKEMCRNKQR